MKYRTDDLINLHHLSYTFYFILTQCFFGVNISWKKS
jgi:hypothetical protein